jgi:hypothetical protein
MAGFVDASDVACRWDDALVIRVGPSGGTQWDRAYDIDRLTPSPDYECNSLRHGRGIKACRKESQSGVKSKPVKSSRGVGGIQPPSGGPDEPKPPGDDDFEPVDFSSKTIEEIQAEFAGLLRSEWVFNQRLHLNDKREIPCVVLCKTVVENDKEKLHVVTRQTEWDYDVDEVKRRERLEQDEIAKLINEKRKIKAFKSSLTPVQSRLCNDMVAELSRRCYEFGPCLPETCLVSIDEGKEATEQQAVVKLSNIPHTVTKGDAIGKYKVVALDAENESIVVQMGDEGQELRIWPENWYKPKGQSSKRQKKKSLKKTAGKAKPAHRKPAGSAAAQESRKREYCMGTKAEPNADWPEISVKGMSPTPDGAYVVMIKVNDEFKSLKEGEQLDEYHTLLKIDPEKKCVSIRRSAGAR